MSTLSDITTHTRASSATYTDANGILQTAAINEPRVGHHIYNGSAWVNEGYFHESEARTNLVTYSQDLVALGVSKTDTTNTSDSFTATAQAGVQTPNIFFNTTLGTGVHTWWVDFTDLVKAPYVVLQTTLFNATANGSSIFDLANQSVVFQSGNHTARIVEVADGVYRCIITLATDGTDNTGRLVIGLSENTTILRITDPDGTESVKVLRQQLEAGSTPSSYIPTSGSTVTRAADTLTIPSANLPWNPLAVSIQMEGTMTYADRGLGSSSVGGQGEVVWVDWRADSSNYVDLVLSTSGSRTGQLLVIQEYSTTIDLASSGFSVFSPGINVQFNISSRHGSTFVNGAVDGVALTANTTPIALPDLSSTDMDIGSIFMGTIKLFRVWADDLTDAGIEEASA